MVMTCSLLQAADQQDVEANTVLRAINAAVIELSAKKLNSMMEAYMMGKFFPGHQEGRLKYAHYAVTDCHQDCLEYDDQVKDINTGLQAMYDHIYNGIGNFELYDFHKKLHSRNKEQQIAYIKNLKEIDKVQIQALRLYDFIRCINIEFSEDATAELKRIESNHQLSKKEKTRLLRNCIIEQQKSIRAIQINRGDLHKALKAHNAEHVLAMCKEHLHTGIFLPFNLAMQKIITDIEAGRDNNLCDNAARLDDQCLVS